MSFREEPAGPVTVITDRGILEPDPASGELVLTQLFPGVAAPDVARDVAWPLRTRDPILEVAPPSPDELAILRSRLNTAPSPLSSPLLSLLSKQTEQIYEPNEQFHLRD